jgi:hypothetical protein
VSRSIGDARLLDACAREGCPVCRCLDEDGRRHVGALLHELVTDPGTRRALRGSWGLCSWHGWMALAVPGARTAVAILHADVVRTVSDRFRQAKRGAGRGGRGDWRRRVAAVFLPDAAAREPPDRRATCLVCQGARRAEGRYLRTLCAVGEDEAVTRAYDASDALCVPHLHLAMERGPTASSLVERTLRRWDELAALLDDFVGKHEYRNRSAITEAEARACERAVETLSGRQGLWPSDLHREPGPRRRGAGTARPRRT